LSLIGTRECETAAHRKRKGIIGQWWSLDADVPIPKRLYVILKTPEQYRVTAPFPPVVPH